MKEKGEQGKVSGNTAKKGWFPFLYLTNNKHPKHQQQQNNNIKQKHNNNNKKTTTNE